LNSSPHFWRRAIFLAECVIQGPRIKPGSATSAFKKGLIFLVDQDLIYYNARPSPFGGRLHPGFLDGFAPKGQSVMTMKVVSLMSDSFGSNCYIVVGEVVAVIDPGLMPDMVASETRGLNYNALMFINTHCHYDHSGCVPELQKKLGGKYLIHEWDAPVVERGMDDFLLASLFGARPFKLDVSRRLHDGDVIDLGKVKIEVVHTPGHTKGSICLYEPASRSLFTGDTVFSEGIGRTDFPGGNNNEMRESIERLIELQEDRGVDKVYPGHGPISNGECIRSAYRMFF
jgi:hydroxyacylglutathione hydrolase